MYSIKFALAFVLGGLCLVEASLDVEHVEIDLTKLKLKLKADAPSRDYAFKTEHRDMLSLALQRASGMLSGHQGSSDDCTPGDVVQWATDELLLLDEKKIEPTEFMPFSTSLEVFEFFKDEWDLDKWAFLEKYFYDNDEGDEYLGSDPDDPNQARAFQMLNQAQSLFPSEDTDDVLLMGVHPEELLGDVSRIQRMVQLELGLKEGEQSELTMSISRGIQNYLRAAGIAYDHPLFSLNAMSFPRDQERGIPPKILYGDGLNEVYKQLGFDAYARETTVAHEFAHQMQLASDLVPSDLPRNNQPQWELMADFLGGYISHHPQGFGFGQRKMGMSFFVAESTGDCKIFKPSGSGSIRGNGTPDQRVAAVQLAVDFLDLQGFFDLNFNALKDIFKEEDALNIEAIQDFRNGIPLSEEAKKKYKKTLSINTNKLVKEFNRNYDSIVDL